MYKQLYRAAKAKLKLRVKAVVVGVPTPQPTPQEVVAEPTEEKKKDDPAEEEKKKEDVSAIPRDLFPTYVPVQKSDGAFLPVISHTHTSPSTGSTFYINCNSCGRSIPDEHHHCSICEDGDYDLCTDCVKTECCADGHWMIKRSVKDGIILNSFTETVTKSAKPSAKVQGNVEEQANVGVQANVDSPKQANVESVKQANVESVKDEPSPKVQASALTEKAKNVATQMCAEMEAAFKSREEAQGNDKVLCNGCFRGKDVPSSIYTCSAADTRQISLGIPCMPLVGIVITTTSTCA